MTIDYFQQTKWAASNLKTNLIKYSPNISITANNQRLKAIHLFSLPPEEQEFAVEVLYPRIN